MSKTFLSACILLLTLSACSSNNRYDAPQNRSGLKVKEGYLVAVLLESEITKNHRDLSSNLEKHALIYFTANAGTLTAVRYGDTHFTHFNTDAQGNVTAATGNKGGITFTYSNGLITTATYHINGAPKPQVTRYRYDAQKRIIEVNTVFADRNSESLIKYKYGDDGANNPVASHHYLGVQIDTVSHYWGYLKSPYSTLPPIVRYLHIDIPMGDKAVVAEVSTLKGTTKKISYFDRDGFIDHSYTNLSGDDSRWYVYNQ